MSIIGYRIYSKIERPDPELVERFRNLPVANIDDVMNRMSCMDAGIKPLNKAVLCGTAFTVKAPGGDNLVFNKAIDMAQPGDVLVVSSVGFADRSFSGDGMASYAKVRGIAGFVIDGQVRDRETTGIIDFPVYARGVQANGPYKFGPGEINVPVACGGQVVCPGDIIIGDQDGVIVIPKDFAADVIEEAIKKRDNDDYVSQALMRGENAIGDRSWIDEKLDPVAVYMD